MKVKQLKKKIKINSTIKGEGISLPLFFFCILVFDKYIL